MPTTEDCGFSLYGRESLSIPVLISVPHAGRDYPEIVHQTLRLAPEALLRLEDRYADLLVKNVVNAGFPAIIAHRARAWIDLNRDDKDIDVEMVRNANPADYPAPGAKQRGGLGLIPRRLAGHGDIWKRQFELSDIQERITQFHRPYHDAISDILLRMKRKFGVAVLLDLHSMPPIRNSQLSAPPQFVIGDRFGKSSASPFPELIIEQIRMAGFQVALNHPYSGEYILRLHARPHSNIHALQLEVDRALYLDSSMREPGIFTGRIADLICNLVRALAEQALGSEAMIAAE